MIGAVGVGGAMAVGAASAAVGSIVSQAVGVATGIQDKFSWNAVALAAIGGGVGAGVGGGAVTRAMTSNLITQGIGVATGLQDKFSWASVAAAGVAAAVGRWVAPKDVVGMTDNFARTSASTIAHAATRSLIEGSNFGDNMLAALPDAIVQTIGEAIAGGISNRSVTKIGPFAEELKPIKSSAPALAELDPLVPSLRVGPANTAFDWDAVFDQVGRSAETPGAFFMRSLNSIDVPALAVASDSVLHDVAQFVRANGRTISAGAQAAAGIEGVILEWLPETQFTRDLNTVLGQIGEGFDNWLAQAPVDASTRNDLRDITPIAAMGAAAVIGGRGVIREVVSEVKVGARRNFTAYEVLTEQPIAGGTRDAHRTSANRALYNELHDNPDFAKALDQELGTDVLAHMRSGESLLNPPGTVWHHPVENSSVMQLLRTSEHTNPLLQPLLHSGPNRTGGFGTHFDGN
jgi:hypothetical protein